MHGVGIVMTTSIKCKCMAVCMLYGMSTGNSLTSGFFFYIFGKSRTVSAVILSHYIIMNGHLLI